MRRVSWIALLATLLPLSGELAAETYIWVDDSGVTHLTDGKGGVPESAKPSGASGDDVRSLWKDGFLGPVTTTPPAFTVDRFVMLMV